MAATRVNTRLGRMYKIPNLSFPLPSVTSVLNVMDKGGLVPWAVKLSLDTVRNELGVAKAPAAAAAAVPAQAKPASGEVVSKEAVAAALDKASGAADRHKKAAADFGTRAHDAINSIIMSGNMDLVLKEEDKDIALVIEGFKRWYRESGIVLHPAGDTVVFSRRYGYAGAADAIGYRKEDGALLVVDFKTSNSVHSSYALQLAAYSRAIQEMLVNGEMTAFDDKQDFKRKSTIAGPEAGNLQRNTRIAATETTTTQMTTAATAAAAKRQPPAKRTAASSPAHATTTAASAFPSSSSSTTISMASRVPLPAQADKNTGNTASASPFAFPSLLLDGIGVGMGIGIGGANSVTGSGPTNGGSISATGSNPLPFQLDGFSVGLGTNGGAVDVGNEMLMPIAVAEHHHDNDSNAVVVARSPPQASVSTNTSGTSSGQADASNPPASATRPPAAIPKRPSSPAPPSLPFLSTPVSAPTASTRGGGARKGAGSRKSKSAGSRRNLAADANENEPHAVVCDDLLLATNLEFQQAADKGKGDHSSSRSAPQTNGGDTSDLNAAVLAQLPSAPSSSSSSSSSPPFLPSRGGGGRSFHSLARAATSSIIGAEQAVSRKNQVDLDAAAVAAAWNATAGSSEAGKAASSPNSSTGQSSGSSSLSSSSSSLPFSSPIVEALVVRIERTTGDVFVSRVGNLDAAFAAFKACLLLFHTINSSTNNYYNSGGEGSDAPLLQLVSKAINRNVAQAQAQAQAPDGDDGQGSAASSPPSTSSSPSLSTSIAEADETSLSFAAGAVLAEDDLLTTTTTTEALSIEPQLR